MNSRTKLIFAMPGMGKTTWVKSLNKDKQMEDRPAIDFDYRGTRKPGSKAIAVAQAQLMNAFAKEGIAYITTFPGNIDVDTLNPTLFDVIFIIPPAGKVSTLVNRAIERGDDPDQPFIQNYRQNGEQMREGWLKDYARFKSRFPGAQLIETDKYVADVVPNLT